MVLAGSLEMPWRTMLVAAVMGSAPEAVLYALAGSFAPGFGNTALVFLLLLGGALGVHLLVRPPGAARRLPVAE